MPKTFLKRYSKPHGAGDQTSGGRGKLLKSTTNLTRTEILVRETLQNAWDAKAEGWYPAYGIRIYRPEPEVRQILKDQVFNDPDPSLNVLARSLADPDSFVLEIYDRGTVGLNGPIRPNEAAADAAKSNFNSFVFDIGSTKPTGSAAGGTYGFGKTAAFEASAVHSLVYWSAAENEDGLTEHRLIATSLHEPYEKNGKRYTGAHWWGAPEDEEIIPLTGSRAQRIGEAVFRTHFGQADDGDLETGTSILVIDPLVNVSSGEGGDEQVFRVRSDEQAEELMSQIVAAVQRHAWPKMIADADGETPMQVETQLDRMDQNVADQAQQNFGEYANALVHVRTAQGETYSQADLKKFSVPMEIKSATFPIVLGKAKLEEIKGFRAFYGNRRDRLVGHLHLTKSLRDPNQRTTNTVPANAVAFMRGGAELIVNYQDYGSEHDELIVWHGVFKPTPEVDMHFAATEPPTHDAWTPNIAESEVSKSIVARTLSLISARVTEFVDADGRSSTQERISTKRIASELSIFAPVGAYQEPDKKPAVTSQRSASRRISRDLVEIVSHDERQSHGSSDAMTHAVSFTVSPRAQSNVEVVVTARTMTFDGRLEMEADEYQVQWSKLGPFERGNTAKVYRPGASGVAVCRFPFSSQVEISVVGRELE